MAAKSGVGLSGLPITFKLPWRPALGRNMYGIPKPFLRIVHTKEEEGGIFGPDEIAVMMTAFEQVLRDLKITDRDDPIAEMVAQLVIEFARNGEGDSVRLHKRVLARHSAEACVANDTRIAPRKKSSRVVGRADKLA